MTDTADAILRVILVASPTPISEPLATLWQRATEYVQRHPISPANELETIRAAIKGHDDALIRSGDRPRESDYDRVVRLVMGKEPPDPVKAEMLATLRDCRDWIENAPREALLAIEDELGPDATPLALILEAISLAERRPG